MKPRDVKVVKVLGKVGWVAKALVYSIIGGQACNSAVGDDSTGSISPQARPISGHAPARCRHARDSAQA